MGHAGGMESDAVTVREARPSDAFSVGALHIQDEREQGHAVPPGFLDALSDAWLRDRARRTWVAEDERGRPLGVLHGTRVQKLPSAHRPADAWFHVSLLFVTQDARGLRHRRAAAAGAAGVGRDRRGDPGAAQLRAGGPHPLRADGVRASVGAADGAAAQRPKSALSWLSRTLLPDGSRKPDVDAVRAAPRAPRRTRRRAPSAPRRSAPAVVGGEEDGAGQALAHEVAQLLVGRRVDHRRRRGSPSARWRRRAGRAGSTVSQRKLPISGTVTSLRTSKPTFSV